MVKISKSKLCCVYIVHVLSSSEHEGTVFMYAVWLCVFMYSCIVRVCAVGRHLSICKSLSIIGRRMLTTSATAPKVVDFLVGPKTQNVFFFENGCKDFDLVSVSLNKRT
jgi:hypothetical protein